ncbi:Polyphenol oxidase [Paraconexibacter sp. AEG42_29]|uniref:Polyphenol oxidase n=1 Tax=Paraconexibacter sp. AEG42_29 TaxID=2997339 RepID=A0AAU7AV35_9ACTN
MTGLPAPFRWDGPLLAVALDGAQARFTGRPGGVSTGPFASLDLARYAPERAADVARNLAALGALTGFPPDRWAQSHQVHGTVVHHTAAGDEPGDPQQEGDGQVVTSATVAGVVLTADCLPVVVSGLGGVAVLHAGWRGLADGVLEAGVRVLRRHGVGGTLQAAIGPGAGGCCYEVGPDVRDAFAADGVLQRTGPGTIDLKAIAARRLAAAGVATIHDCELCTMCTTDAATGDRRFFSHRADGGVTGRQAAIAWRS